MSRNNTHPSALPPLRRKCKGYEGRLIPAMHVISIRVVGVVGVAPSEVIFSARLDIFFPLIFLLDLREHEL